MPSFRHSFKLPNDQWTMVNRTSTLEVRISKPTSLGVITFAVTLPEELVERVRGVHPDYTDSYAKPFTATLVATSFPDLLGMVADLGQAALIKRTIEEIHGEKTLFVHVRSTTLKQREQLHGGELENLSTIQFGYFVGYLKQTTQESFHFNRTLHFNHIYTAWLPPRGSESPGYHGTYNKGGELVPVTMEKASASTAFEYYQKRYRFIPYTEEREAFLETIQDRLGAITTQLNSFFEELTPEKMDQLMLDTRARGGLLGPGL